MWHYDNEADRWIDDEHWTPTAHIFVWWNFSKNDQVDLKKCLQEFIVIKYLKNYSVALFSRKISNKFEANTQDTEA